MRESRIVHADSLAKFLLFCKQLSALIAIPVGWFVRGRFQGVMAALDAAIHENTGASI